MCDCSGSSSLAPAQTGSQSLSLRIKVRHVVWHLGLSLVWTNASFPRWISVKVQKTIFTPTHTCMHAHTQCSTHNATHMPHGVIFVFKLQESEDEEAYEDDRHSYYMKMETV